MPSKKPGEGRRKGEGVEKRRGVWMKRRSIGLENGGVQSATCSAPRFCPPALLESPRGDAIRDALVHIVTFLEESSVFKLPLQSQEPAWREGTTASMSCVSPGSTVVSHLSMCVIMCVGVCL
uniref:Uncharacterized protein n=1 Tax=Mus spicilegus TaxID=10103 RepID=A0A8C6GSB6_MUSSI